MDARLVFLLLVMTLFGAAPLTRFLRRRWQRPEPSPASDPLAEATRTSAGAETRAEVRNGTHDAPSLEREIESGPDCVAYSAGFDAYRDAFLRRAHFRAAAGRLDEAMADYEEAERCEWHSDEGPGVFDFDLTRGFDTVALLAGLDAVIAAEPGCLPARRERAYQRLCAGDVQGAIRDCDAVLAHEPGDGFPRALRGVAL